MGSTDNLRNKTGLTFHFWVHYRNLRNLDGRSSYPTTTMEKCIYSLSEATIFPTLDANSGYCRVEIEDERGDKTAFKSHHGF